MGGIRQGGFFYRRPALLLGGIGVGGIMKIVRYMVGLVLTFALLYAWLELGCACSADKLAYCDVLSLIFAVVLGGLFGGLVYSLSGRDEAAAMGESATGQYKLRLPSFVKDQNGQQTVEVTVCPGFLGDMFVGLMAAMVVVGGVDQLTGASFFDQPLLNGIASIGPVQNWFRHFTVAFIGGFLGIRLIRQVADKVQQELNQVKAQAKLTAAEQKKIEAQTLDLYKRLKAQEADNAFAMGKNAYMAFRRDKNQLSSKVAENEYMTLRKLEGDTSIRGAMCLAELAWERQDAEAALHWINEAIEKCGNESQSFRIATAYFNRACYVAKMSGAEKIAEVVEDVRRAVHLDPGNYQQLTVELAPGGDFHHLKDAPEFKALLLELGQSPPPAG